MKHNLSQEFRTSMDSLRFSDKTKEEMVMKLMNETNPKPRSGSKRKTLVLILAAAIALVTFTGAGIYTHWSRSMQSIQQMSELEKNAADKSGLSVMLEETKAAQPEESSKEIVSVTDNDITITAVQSIVDQYRAMLVFRVDGFQLPKGEQPSLEGGVVTINGKEPTISWVGSYYDGVKTQSDGSLTYDDGTPVEYDSNHSVIPRYLDKNGSFEYILDMSLPTSAQENGLQPLEHLNSEIVVKFTSVGIFEGLDHKSLVDGDWTLKWTLTGTDKKLSVTPNAAIGDSGFTLDSLELSPISANIIVTGDPYAHPQRSDEKLDTPAPRCPVLAGFRMKDGSFIERDLNAVGTSGMNPMDADTFELFESYQIIEPENVVGLAFYNMDDPDNLPVYEVSLK